MPSLSHQLVVGLLRAARADRVFSDPERAGEHVRRRSIRPRSYGPPRLLRRDVTVTVEQRDGWPVYTLAPRDGRARGGLVYAHGGGWVNEVVAQHWHLAAKVAAEAQTTVLLPVYPLVPFGTAGEVVPAFADLVLESGRRHGATCLAGDSAGGQIALSAAVLLRDRNQVTVPLTVLISPALDLTLLNPGIDEVLPTDPWLGREGTRVFIEHWRGDLPVVDPRVSPLAADLAGLGPVVAYAGTRDIVTPDTRLLVERAGAAGVDVELHEGRDLVHVYPLLPTPEGRRARAHIVEQVRAVLDRAAPGPGEAQPACSRRARWAVTPVRSAWSAR